MTRSAKGLSLIEILVSIVIIGVLLGLTIPLLSRVRGTSVELVCMVQMRFAGQALASYAADGAGLLPFAGYRERTVELPGGFEVTVGGVEGFAGGSWASLFPEQWSAEGLRNEWKCPRQPRYDPDAPSPPHASFSVDGVFPGTLYAMSDAVWLDPRTLRRGASVEGFRAAPNAVADVTFPSKKALLFELIAFCIEDPEGRFWIDLGQTPMHPSSVLTVDGSARRFVRNDAFPTVIGGLGYTHTVDGVRGRDLP